MPRCRPSSRWALWAFAAALLLKSAMPWLASASAARQGIPLVEVCSVYGVSMVPLGSHGQATDPAHPGEPAGIGHADDHCALGALTALATGAARLPSFAPVVLRQTGPPVLPASSLARDAAARWTAGVRHGPPVSA